MTDNIVEKEHIGFGPWLVEITDWSDVPIVFRNVYNFDESVKIAFKIPVHKDRRNVRMGDVLYDKLVSLGDEGIYVYEYDFVTDEVYLESIQYCDIKYIQNETRLLKCKLKLHKEDGTFEVGYNKVSYEFMTRVIRFVRERYIPNLPVRPCVVPQETIEPNVHEMMPVYWNMFMMFSKQEHVKLVSHHVNKKTEKTRMNPFDAMYSILNWRIIQGNMILAADNEYILVHRINNVKRRFDADYSTVETYIPYANLSAVSTSPDPDFPDTYDTFFEIGSTKLPLMAVWKKRE